MKSSFPNSTSKNYLFPNVYLIPFASSSETSPYFASGFYSFFSSSPFNRLLIFSYKLIELGWPVKTIVPLVSTRQTNGIPLIAKDLISG